jgi:hypothetical protein
MNVLRQLSRAMNAFVLAVDHHGKNPASGVRGASSREASADVVLTALGERDEDGIVTDTRFSLKVQAWR